MSTARTRLTWSRPSSSNGLRSDPYLRVLGRGTAPAFVENAPQNEGQDMGLFRHLEARRIEYTQIR
jgi:hypothetical protein